MKGLEVSLYSMCFLKILTFTLRNYSLNQANLNFSSKSLQTVMSLLQNRKSKHPKKDKNGSFYLQIRKTKQNTTYLQVISSSKLISANRTTLPLLRCKLKVRRWINKEGLQTKKDESLEPHTLPFSISLLVQVNKIHHKRQQGYTVRTTHQFRNTRTHGESQTHVHMR